MNKNRDIDAEMQFIGHITTPYERIEDCPNNIQPDGPECRIYIDAIYQDSMVGLETGQHIMILYWLGAESRRRFYAEENGTDKGVFTLRSPHRPNPIGVAVVPVAEISGGYLHVQGMDCLNGTKLLDIKPAMKREVTAA